MLIVTRHLNFKRETPLLEQLQCTITFPLSTCVGPTSTSSFISYFIHYLADGTHFLTLYQVSTPMQLSSGSLLIHGPYHLNQLPSIFPPYIYTK